MTNNSTDDDPKLVTEPSNLKSGDQVEVRLPGVVQVIGDFRYVNFNDSDPNPTPVQRYTCEHIHDLGGSVYLVCAADDPSHDLVGTVRAAEGDVWVRVRPEQYDGNGQIWWNLMTGEEMVGGGDLRDVPVIGVVPGTPASFKEQGLL